MSLGLSVAHATGYLNVKRNTTYTGIAAVYLQLHTDVGEPGAAGTSNVSAIGVRNLVTFGAPTGSGPVTMAGTVPNFTMTATENIKYFTLWTASSGGTFLESGQFAATVPVISSSVLTVSVSLSFPQIAT